jgi:hypothetical protein
LSSPVITHLQTIQYSATTQLKLVHWHFHWHFFAIFLLVSTRRESVCNIRLQGSPVFTNLRAEVEKRADEIWLAYAGETKIRRHVKIRRQVNPFDPQWRSYLAERALRKKFGLTRQTVKKTPS